MGEKQYISLVERGFKPLRLLSALLLGCLLSLTTAANDPELKEEPVDTELKGLVIDKTLTPPGRRFYREFARLWWEQDKSVPGNLVVRELPSALRGSQVAIVFNRKPLYGTVLSPARSSIEQKAEAAVNTVEQQVQRVQLSKLFDNNPDLASDDEF